MKIRNPFMTFSDREINKVEEILSRKLKPVEISQDFKSRLRSQLIGDDIKVETRQILGMKMQDLKATMIVVGAILGGAIVLLSGTWIVVLLAGRKGKLDSIRNMLKIGKVRKAQSSVSAV